MPDEETAVYLYRISKFATEDGKLEELFRHASTGPRDVVGTPNWAKDSSRLAFTCFVQKTRPGLRLRDALATARTRPSRSRKRQRRRKQPTSQARTRPGATRRSRRRNTRPRLVNRFHHHGGPNTPRMMQPEYVADNRRLILLTEQSGFRHLHVLDPLYENLDQLTRGRFEVYPIEISKDRKWMFATSTKKAPSLQHVYRVNLETGEMKILSSADGVYSTARGVAERPAPPRELRHLRQAQGARRRRYQDGHDEGAHRFASSNRPRGHDSEARVLQVREPPRPRDPRPSLQARRMDREGQASAADLRLRRPPGDAEAGDRRQLLVRRLFLRLVHGEEAWLPDLHHRSPRNVGLRRRLRKGQLRKSRQAHRSRIFRMAWRTSSSTTASIRRRWGCTAGASEASRPRCVSTPRPRSSRSAWAGAGPTEWENYNAWYSTGTIGNSREGNPDLVKYSLLPLAKNLKGKLLLVHGMEDSNVLYQDTVRVYRELLKAGKGNAGRASSSTPTGGHGLGG